MSTLSIHLTSSSFPGSVSIHLEACAATIQVHASRLANVTDGAPPPTQPESTDPATRELRLVEDDIRARTSTTGPGTSVGDCARAVLFNGLGRYDAAKASARLAIGVDDPGVVEWGVAELVEASARIHELDEAAAALRTLDDDREGTVADWALGLRTRSRALLSSGEGAERLYRQSLDLLAVGRPALQHARTHLVYGEWLRRANRRVDSRKQLGTAHEMFAALQMSGFGMRAQRELAATGANVRKRSVETALELTSQEMEIASLAADGRTNLEIGEELFISSRTVEWHLRKVFTKLGVTSRRCLRAALAVAPQKSTR